MAIEIRPVTPAETREYLRVLPYVNGLPQEEPQPSAWYAGHAAWPPQVPATEEMLDQYVEEARATGSGHRPRSLDGKIAGGSAIVSVQVALPGGRQLPLGGVTSTAVLPTYRRRAVAEIVTRCWTTAGERRRVLAGLSASRGHDLRPVRVRSGDIPAPVGGTSYRRSSRADFADPSLELVDGSVAAGVGRSCREGCGCASGQISPLPGKRNGLATAWFAGGRLRTGPSVHRNPTGDVDGASLSPAAIVAPDPEHVGTAGRGV